MIRESNYEVLVSSSLVAGFCSGIFTNTLDVIKTRIMNLAMSAHGNSSVFHLSGLKHACTCYACFIRDLVRKEGTRALFRGVWYNTAMSMVRSSMLFPLYELCLRYSTEVLTRNNYQNLVGYTPALAGLFSKFLSLSVTFPLEYMAVLSQAKMSENKKQMTHGFGYTMYRELLYSSCFWSIQDWLYKSLKSSDFADRTAYITSSFISSMVSALVSYPFDLFKTWKISHPERMKERNPFRIASDIAKERGLGPLIGGRSLLTIGIIPRLVRVGTGNFIFFSMYTKCVEIFSAHPRM